jgi:gamma-glutamylcyclotransferase (GGCT)/AIG2-like uncharacterized protein YtfP
MYHYAYGSNLSSSYLREYCPSATFVMKADLPNYRVEFRHYSEESGGGISTIIEAPGRLVRGVVYEIPEPEMDAMDRLESVSAGLYKRETFLVLGADGEWHHADMYRVTQPTGPYAPARSYLDKMIAGAREHGLDAEYIESLVALRQSLDGEEEQ